MPNPLVILAHTPWWAFALCAVLVAFGVQALRPRRVPVARLLIVPAVFIAWGIISLAMRSAASPVLAVGWLACGAAGLAIGWLTTRLDGVQIDRAAGRIVIPGSAVPLVRNLSIFAVKYALGVATALAPAWRGDIALWDIGVSGLSAGYFAAWLLRLALRYRGAAQTTMVAQPR